MVRAGTLYPVRPGSAKIAASKPGITVRVAADGGDVGRTRKLIAALMLLLLPAVALAQASRQITKRSDPLVRSLEALYAESMQVARTGDLDAYWRLRTAASKDRPPHLTRELLPLFATMLPPLDTLNFVRIDSSAATARALYRWPRNDMARYTVIVYRVEDKAWKIDSILVKSDVHGDALKTDLPDQAKQRAALQPQDARSARVGSEP